MIPEGHMPHPDIPWAKPRFEIKEGDPKNTFGVIAISNGSHSLRVDKQGNINNFATREKKLNIVFGTLEKPGFIVTLNNPTMNSLLQDPDRMREVQEAAKKLLEGIGSEKAARASIDINNREGGLLWEKMRTWGVDLNTKPSMIAALNEAKDLVDRARTLINTARESTQTQTEDAATQLRKLGIKSVTEYLYRDRGGSFSAIPGLKEYEVPKYLPKGVAV